LESAWVAFLGGDFVSSRPKVPQIVSFWKKKIVIEISIKTLNKN
jgi:hypothetical protein